MGELVGIKLCFRSRAGKNFNTLDMTVEKNEADMERLELVVWQTSGNNSKFESSLVSHIHI